MMKKKVLVIDDEKLLVKSTCMALGHYGYEAKGVFDGMHGLQSAREDKPDVILLDIMMPGMDGWQVLESLKQTIGTQNIPVIIFTAREYADGKEMASQKGAADYVAKPFELADLAAVLDKQVALFQNAAQRNAL
jgi:CheY-like chemotaxis protein